MENWMKRSFENVYATMALNELIHMKDSIEKKLFSIANLEVDFFIKWMKKCNDEDYAVLMDIYTEEIESLL